MYRMSAARAVREGSAGRGRRQRLAQALCSHTVPATYEQRPNDPHREVERLDGDRLGQKQGVTHFGRGVQLRMRTRRAANSAPEAKRASPAKRQRAKEEAERKVEETADDVAPKKQRTGTKAGSVLSIRFEHWCAFPAPHCALTPIDAETTPCTARADACTRARRPSWRTRCARSSAKSSVSMASARRAGANRSRST